MAKRKSNNSTKSAGGNASASRRHSPMDVDLLERLVKLMASNDLNTVDLRDGDQRVVLKRGALVAASAGSGFYPHPVPGAFAPSYAHPPGPASGAASGASTAPTASASAPPGAGDSDKDLLAIKSPMVGTFYAAPSPDAPPFVSVGDSVDEETDVCIIEAMKVFNNIKAECRGSIAKVLVSDGQTVEFGQVLFLVKPA